MPLCSGKSMSALSDVERSPTLWNIFETVLDCMYLQAHHAQRGCMSLYLPASHLCGVQWPKRT